MQTRGQTTSKRALGLSALGVLLAIAGGWVAYQGYTTLSSRTTTLAPAYEYTVNQSAKADIAYFDSSFYESKTQASRTPLSCHNLQTP